MRSCSRWTDAADLAHAGQAGQGARDHEHDDDRPLDVDAGVARGTRVVADEADLVAPARPLSRNQTSAAATSPKMKPEVDGQAAEAPERRREVGQARQPRLPRELLGLLEAALAPRPEDPELDPERGRCS